MHILLATNDIFPDPEAGGSGRYVHETGTRLVKRGHEVTVITRRRGNTSVRDTIAGMDVYRYNGSITSLPEAAQTVSKWCAEIDEESSIDLLNFHGALSATLVDRALPPSIPRVYTFHGPWPAEYRERNRERPVPLVTFGTHIRRILEGYVLAHSHLTITLSKFMRSQLREWHGDAPNGPVIPGGVDVTRFSPSATADISLDAESVTFLTVRRLTPRMGLETLVDAFADMQSDHPDTHLYIAGDGPLRPTLEQQVRDCGIMDSVTFLGFVPEESLPGTYAAADVFVLPTTALEGFGLATLEALASGTPVIGTAVGGTTEILRPLDEQRSDGPPMLLSDRSQFAARLGEWADCSAATRRAAGNAASEYVRSRFTWDQTTDRLIEIFANLSEGSE